MELRNWAAKCTENYRGRQHGNVGPSYFGVHSNTDESEFTDTVHS